MNEIRTLLRLAGKRLEMTAFARVLHLVAIFASGVVLALAVADRAPGEPFVAWTWIAPSLLIVVLTTAALIWRRQRPTELQVALSVDERLDLRERLSTALHCHRRDDAFAQTALDDAVRTARDPRARETVRRRFRVQPPHRWWVSPLLLLIAVAVLLLPQADLFAGDGDVDEAALTEAKSEVDNTLEVLVKAVEDKPELAAELGDLANELGQTSKEGAELVKPEAVKRDALKKVTELNKRLDDLINGEKGKTSKALEDMMSKLESPEGGPAKELADALAQGDFQKAQKTLEKMLEDAKNGEMDAAQKEQLEQQLEALAAQLEKLAEQQEQLEQALKQAGLDPQLANNPQALQQALQQAQNLNQQQKQQLQQMAQAQQAAQQMCQGLGGACRQLGQAMKNGQPGQAGQNMQGQLNQMEQLQQLLQQAQAAAQQCQGECKGLGQGMNLNQALQQWQQGGGMGRWGQGAGGKAPISPTPTRSKLTKADAPVGQGEIIASMLIEGVPIKGESKAKLRKVVEASAEGYDEALTEDPLPRRYHEAQKHYFGELQRQVEAVKASDPEPATETPAETGSEPAAEPDGGKPE